MHYFRLLSFTNGCPLFAAQGRKITLRTSRRRARTGFSPVSFLSSYIIPLFFNFLNKKSGKTGISFTDYLGLYREIIVCKAERIDGVLTQRIQIIYNCIGVIYFFKMDYKTALLQFTTLPNFSGVPNPYVRAVLTDFFF
jgi:hypothetical protein